MGLHHAESMEEGFLGGEGGGLGRELVMRLKVHDVHMMGTHQSTQEGRTGR